MGGLVLIICFSCGLLTGCVYALHKYNQPGVEKMCITSKKPGALAVRIEEPQETAIPADGRVNLNIPRLPRGCSVYLFGAVKVADGSPERVRAIQVLRDGVVVRKLSLDDIHRLPLDADGYRLLKL